MSGWGEDRVPGGWGEEPAPGGWGGPAYGTPGYAPGYGVPGPGGPYDPASGGWAPYPGAEGLGARRRRIALWLGFGSLVLVALAFVLLVAGVFTFLLGGVVLWLVAFAAGVAGALMAVASLVFAAIATGSPAGSRFLVALPALATLLLVGPASFGSVVTIRGSETGMTHLEPGGPAATPPPPGTEPAEIAEDVADALWLGDDDIVCLLLATAARTEHCADDPLLDREYEMSGSTELIRRSDLRALVSYRPAFGDGPTQRIRLVHEAEGWRVLDLPGIPDRCVDSAEDPFDCPVRAVGAAR